MRPGPVVLDIGLLKPKHLELTVLNFESPLLPTKFPEPAMSNRIKCSTTGIKGTNNRSDNCNDPVLPRIVKREHS
jgi:hypothetical protein